MRIIRKFHYQSYSPLGLDKILTLGNVNKFPFLSLNRIFALSLDKRSGVSAIKMKVFWPFILYCARFALSLQAECRDGWKYCLSSRHSQWVAWRRLSPPVIMMMTGSGKRPTCSWNRQATSRRCSAMPTNSPTSAAQGRSAWCRRHLISTTRCTPQPGQTLCFISKRILSATTADLAFAHPGG